MLIESRIFISDLIIPQSSYIKVLLHVQSNQKMHDLYATKHIFQMALPDAFWAV